MKRLLNLFYSAIHGTHWMYYGAIMSFSSVFLLGKNYTNSEIGVIISAASILAVILQPLLADIADRSRKASLTDITGIIAIGLLAATLSLYFFPSRSLILSIVFVMIAAWLSTLHPLINAMTFYLGSSGHPVNFGIARSFGSVAYAVLCVILGSMVISYGIAAIPAAGAVSLVLLFISLIITDKLFKKSSRAVSAGETVGGGIKRPAQDTETIGLKAFITRNKAFIVFSVGIMFVFFQNSVYNTYLLQITTAVGGTSSDMGRLFSFVALLEIPGLIFFSRFRERFSCQFMLKFASAAFVVKVFLSYIATSVTFLYAAFLFQLISLPFFLSASVYLVDEVMEKGEAVKGQSFITGMMTLSNVFASLLGGAVLDLSGASLLLLISTIFCAMGTLIVFAAVGRIRPKKARPASPYLQ